MRRSKNKKNNRETGSRHELQAAAFLTDRGYVILEKNYRCRTGEIDLIAKTAAILFLSRLNSGAAKGAEIRRKPSTQRKKAELQARPDITC